MTATAHDPRRSLGAWFLRIAVLGLLVLQGLAPPAMAEPRTRESTPRASASAFPLVLFNREIIELRTSLGGLDPRQRAERAQARFAALDTAALSQPVALQPRAFEEGSGYSVLVGEQLLFTVLSGDRDPEEPITLRELAERARHRTEAAVQARAAQSEPMTWVRGAGVLLLDLLVYGAGFWVVRRLQRLITQKASSSTQDAGWRLYTTVVLWRLLRVGVWLIMVALAYAGAVALLSVLPWSQPWALTLTDSVHALVGWTLSGMVAAVPGIMAVAVILILARVLQDVLRMALDHVQAGRVQVPGLHAETVSATRRLLTVLIWGLAAAIAYPYLPGSGSEAFKGLSVLFGLMLTLGSTGVVTQLMSGLVVVYSRSLKKGDFVAVGEVEGVVREVGPLAVKVINIRNEEITVPHATLVTQPVHNFSKLAGEQGTLISTRVTIGYDAPWRQVHAMLVEAALHTEGVRPVPQPFVYQRALSDFYVEYELYAHIDRPIERVPILSRLHGAIQDAFNRHGVQIMSPHFFDQPPSAVVVPESRWYTPPAAPASGNGSRRSDGACPDRRPTPAALTAAPR